MAKSAGYYNVDDFNAYKKKQGKCIPPRANVLVAACHIQGLFDAKKFTYGFMGGLPMLCLGYKREMPDLHIAYDDKDFLRLKSKLENDRRIRLPTGLNPLLPFKILVWTGPDYKDQGCSINASIELDLVPSGACSTPGAGELNRSLVLLGLQTASGRQMVFKSLNVQYLLSTLLSYCKARALSWDPRKDILWLCKNETAELQRVVARLNTKEVREMFLGTAFFSRLPVQDQRLCYRTLLDTEPPPIMAITPPDPYSQQRQEQVNEARAPRSRYRHVSGQRSSSDGTAEHGTARHTRPQSMDHLQDPRHVARIQGVQCVHSAKPQSVSAAAAAKQARKSMPNLTAPHTVQQPRASQTCGVREGQGSLLGYGGGFQPVHASVVSGGTVNDGVQHTTTSRTDSTRTDSTGTVVHGIQSQKGSLHVVSPEGETGRTQKLHTNDDTTPERLHLVGPEGVYCAPPAQIPVQTPAQPPSQHQRHSSAPPPQTEPAFFFEVDTTRSSPAYIAELPAESVPSAVSNSLRSEAHVRRSNLGTASAPLSAPLPASLVAGGLGTRGHRQSLGHTALQNEPALFSTRQTNAYRYSSYAFPTISTNFAAPTEEAQTYKAYRPLATLEQLSRNDSVSSVYSPVHKRQVSHNSTAPHESDKLASEYRELLNFADGYGVDDGRKHGEYAWTAESWDGMHSKHRGSTCAP